MTATYERAVESLRSVSRQMDAADLSASDLVMATVAVNAMEAELAHLRAIEEAAIDLIANTEVGAWPVSDALRAALGETP